MPRRFPLLAAAAASLLLSACGDGGGDGSGASGQPPVPAPTVTSTTAPAIEGVETFRVEPAHQEGPVAYPQTPPVGGTHNPEWTRCGFYEEPVPTEHAVHSLEHGAIWITYRPDLPGAEVDALAALAAGRGHVLVSRWDDGLPSPVVATSWGRQLRLESADDPRLAEFVRSYINQAPEPDAPC